MSEESEESEEERLIRDALLNPRAQRALVRRLDDLVRAPVRIMLRRWPGQSIAGMDQDDLVSEVFAALFADEGRDLLRFDPQRGSLKNYVSMYARTRLRDLERKELRRTAIFPPPSPLDRETIENVGQNDAPPDEVVIVAEYAMRLRNCLDKKFTTSRAQEMVRLLYDQGMSTDEIQSLGIDRPAIFRWRSTILNAARECIKILERENGPSRRRSP